MAKQAAEKHKDKDKGKDKDKSKAHKPSGPPADAKAKKPKPKAAAPEAPAAPAEVVEKPKPAPRPPADLRLKVLKKFHGKFLPKGPLRDRLKTLMRRWDSGEDHGDVTVDELKSLYNDWKAARAKPARAVKV